MCSMKKYEMQIFFHIDIGNTFNQIFTDLLATQIYVSRILCARI